MKPLLISSLSIVLICQMFAQEPVPINTQNIGVSRGTDYALINDINTLEIDKNNSQITFDFLSENTSGTISGLDFKISLNPDDPDNASFKGTALVKTLDTDNFIRDGHLMWQKFFYKRKYPKISFESTQVVDFDNNTFKVVGNLTIKGTQKEAIITFTLDDQKLVGTTTLYTSDFDVNIHKEREKNKLNVRFYFPLLK
ncbi:YceI family protein [Aquimarina sp. 2201CG5-10]|uniref:YceI family protein n=1 Tax=Aquimarina callyspongiae TaxID=3098150 RepID=UPI002AB5D573|nr:YceI family protein [Aquimarina sp. 2201CG5-10]MDY8136096.1 YceI family protein [Aquimarina sp. 2201CG5-10]